MHKAAVLRVAAREGLTLVRADNATGFKGVFRNEKACKSKPYQVQLYRGGKHENLGDVSKARQ